MARIRKRAWTTAGEIRSAWCLDFIDQAGRRQRRQFEKKREAEAFRVKVEGQVASGEYRADAAKFTVGDACADFLVHVRGRQQRGERMTRHNVATLAGHIANYVAPQLATSADREEGRFLVNFAGNIGAVKLAQLTTRSVCEFRDRLRTAGVSVPTTRKILGTLHGILAHAITRDLIAVNVAAGVKVIGRRDEGSKKIVPPTKQVMRALIKTPDPDFRVVLIFAAASGLRAGELWALRWRHLDLDKGKVGVETRVDAYREEDTTKTAAGLRTVPLGQDVIKELKAWKLRSKFSKPDDLVFPNRRGGYTCHANAIKRRFKPACKEAIAAGLNWHALRHFAISTWIEAGLSPKTVQTFAGHSSLQVTMDRYGHLFPSDDHKKAMDEIAGALFG